MGGLERERGVLDGQQASLDLTKSWLAHSSEMFLILRKKAPGQILHPVALESSLVRVLSEQSSGMGSARILHIKSTTYTDQEGGVESVRFGSGSNIRAWDVHGCKGGGPSNGGLTLWKPAIQNYILMIEIDVGSMWSRRLGVGRSPVTHTGNGSESGVGNVPSPCFGAYKAPCCVEQTPQKIPSLVRRSALRSETPFAVSLLYPPSSARAEKTFQFFKISCCAC